MLPKGIVKCEEFNEKKSLFEKQLEESPIMPRSSSSMSRFLLQNILIRHFIFVNPDMPGLRQLSVPALPFPTVQTLATAGQKNLFFGFSTYFNTLGQSVFLVLDHQCPKEANPPFCWIRFSSCYLRPLFQQISSQAEYHNYVYEMIHSTQNNPRFSQLTQYFSTLEKVRLKIHLEIN